MEKLDDNLMNKYLFLRIVNTLNHLDSSSLHMVWSDQVFQHM